MAIQVVEGSLQNKFKTKSVEFQDSDVKEVQDGRVDEEGCKGKVGSCLRGCLAQQ